MVLQMVPVDHRNSLDGRRDLNVRKVKNEVEFIAFYFLFFFILTNLHGRNPTFTECFMFSWTGDLPILFGVSNQLNALNPTHSTVANSWFVLISSMLF